MPIPAFNEHGCLPPGLYDCGLPEVQARFASFQASDRRPALFAKLAELFAACRRSGLFTELLVDGSFVTAKSAPNDVDLLAVLKPGHDFERDLPMSEYSLVSRPLLRRRYGFDIVVAEPSSELYQSYVEFFSQVRGAPELRKGLLRLRL
jgi:hypothetical protein